jgi:hypothetical protein
MEQSLGQLASNIMVPLGLLLNLLYMACFIVGASLIFASVIKYLEHRQNPLVASISLVITLFVSGTMLIFLPFISYLTGHGYLYVFSSIFE